MTRSTFTRLVGLALILIITTAIGTGIVRSQVESVIPIAKRASSVERSVSLDKARVPAAFHADKTIIDTPQTQSQSMARLTPIALLMRPCRPRTTIGGRLTRRTDVFGGENPQYRPVKGEQVFLWNAQGDEIARTRTDRNGDYSFPNLCSGTYTVHPGLASPLLPSRYEPSSRTITVPGRINDVRSPAHLDFVRKQPPPPRQAEQNLDGLVPLQNGEVDEAVVDSLAPQPCVVLGGPVNVFGSGFGRQQDERFLKLGGHGIGVPLQITAWSDRHITAVVPNDRSIEFGQWYYIGLQNQDRNWISNISRTINICRRLQ